jgi:signal transduction histidine kinase/DNA-binding response OmpR family regulator
MSMLKRIQVFLTPPSFEDEQKTRTARILNAVLLVAFIVITLYAISNIVFGNNLSSIILSGVTPVFIIGIWFLMRSGRVQLSVAVLAFTFHIATTFGVYTTGSVRAPITTAFLVGIVLAGLLISMRAAIGLFALTAATLIGLWQLEINGQLPAYSPNVGPIQLTTYLGVFAIVLLFMSIITRNSAEAFNRVRDRERDLAVSNRELQRIRTSLEQRVSERTTQLNTSAEVGRAIASILNPAELIQQVVQLISDRFNFYYAAVFIVDEAGQAAVLEGATGEAGRALKERGHKLELNGKSMVSLAISTRRPRLALETEADTMRFANPFLTGTQSEIALPLTVGLKTLGALDVQSTLNNAFDEGTITVLQGLADQIAIALNNAREFQLTQNDAQQTRALLEASRLSSLIGENLGTTIENLLRSISEQVGYDSWLAVTHEAEQAAYTVLASQSADDQESSFNVNETIPLNRQPLTILAQAILSHMPIIIKDAQADARLGYLPATTRQALGGLICMPALLGEQVLGAISLSRSLKSGPITNNDIQLAEALATQLAVAIQNRRLFEEARRSSDELSQLMQLYTHQGWSQFTQLHSTDELHHEYHAPNLKPLDEHVLHQIEDAVEARGLSTIDVADQRIVAVPIALRGEVLGTIGIEDDPDRKWTTDELATLQAVADQVAQSIEAARLLEDSEVSLQEATTLYKASQSITQAGTPNDVLRAIAEEAITSEMIDQGMFAFVLPTGPGDPLQFEVVAEWTREGNDPNQIGRIWNAADVPLLNRPHSEPLAIDDLAHAAENQIDALSRQFFMNAHHATALALIPLFKGGVIGGWLVLESRRGHYHFTEPEIRRYRTLTNQAATLFENQRLFQDVEARVNELSVLTRIGRRIASTLDLNEVLSLIVEETLNATNATQASIALYNEAENALEMRVMRGYEAGAEMVNLGKLFRPGEGFHGQVLLTGQPILTGDVRTNPAYLELTGDTRSEYIVPIRQGELLLGALNLESPEINVFNEADQRLIEALADQAAVAIANARSYEAERQAVERMREVDRLKTQFLANMSHELRTPLNSIIGFSRVIMRGIDGPVTELQTADLQSIYGSGQHLLGLINNILDISKIEAGKMELATEQVDLREIARSVMSTAIALVKDKHVRLEQQIPDELPPIIADPTRVRQIILNLISNASKFTDQGTITLRIEVLPEAAKISVHDTGMGIPSDKLEHIFEEFTQVDASTTRSVGGTGLGLAITRSFVEMHGGRIWVESEMGVGSTFIFTLPWKPKAEEEQVVSLPTDMAAREAGKKVILSIDDDPGVITLYKRYLEKQGYIVIGLTDPSKAIEEAKRLLPFAITLDVMMPSRDGWSLLADLKSTPEISRVPIVVCSIIHDKTKGFSLGAAEYLVKPITEDELLRVLDRVERHGEVKNVLVIDDEPKAIQLIKRILEAKGSYQVLEAENGAQGLARVQAEQPDLIILDLMMPEVDGFTVIETLKGSAVTRDIPVIIVTAKEITREDRDRLDGYAVALFNKGMFTAEQLLNELVNALKNLNGGDVAKV